MEQVKSSSDAGRGLTCRHLILEELSGICKAVFTRWDNSALSAGSLYIKVLIETSLSDTSVSYIQ